MGHGKRIGAFRQAFENKLPARECDRTEPEALLRYRLDSNVGVGQSLIRLSIGDPTVKGGSLRNFRKDKTAEQQSEYQEMYGRDRPRNVSSMNP